MYTILFADDEENIRKALIHSVDWEKLGFNIVGDVSNGIEALEYIEKYDIDLLVTDIKMPIMGGIELARAAREIRPSMQIVILSGYDHFSFAKQAIKYNILEYLLKPITEEQIVSEFKNIKLKLDEKFSEILNIDDHQDMVKELKNTKKDLFISKLITNGLTKHQIEKYMQDKDVEIKEDSQVANKYIVFITKNDINVHTEESDIRNKRLFNITKIISEKYINCVCTSYYDFNVVIAYGTKDTLDKYMPILTKDIVLSAKRVINMKTYVAQSDYYDDVTNTHLAFNQAVQTLKVLDKTDTQIAQINDINKNRMITTTDKLEISVASGDKQKTLNAINEIFDGVLLYGLDFHTTILQILSVLFKTSAMIEPEERGNLWRDFTFDVSNDQMKEEIICLTLSVSDKILHEREQSVDALTQAAVDIIKNEYSNAEINLSYIAQKVHCSPNYLSSVIKKSTGQSFVDILTTIRMEKASSLLLFTNKKIREISEECGYANQHYFSYSFKKYFDKSPNTIRKEKDLTEVKDD